MRHLRAFSISVVLALGSLSLVFASDVSIPPDPAPLVEKVQWVYDLRWDKGDIYLVRIERMDLAEARATPRVMGRFALELFEGPALIERVRFDFPGLGDTEKDGAPRNARIVTRIGVIFPATKRGTRLELWDRATNIRYALDWPVPIAVTDAGAG